ncbi:MAG: EAL domain-containing protein [Cycloclasticus sp.]
MYLNENIVPETGVTNSQSDILDTCSFGIIILDNYSRLIHWNNWVSKHSGLTLNDKKGEYFELIFPILTKTRLLNAIDDALNYRLPSTLSHKLSPHSLPLHNRQGKQVAHNIKIIPLKQPQDTYHCLIEITDVSAVVKRENQLHDISAQIRREKKWASVTLLSIADAVITTDPEGRIITVNDTAEKLTGLTRSSMQGTLIDRVCPLSQDKENLTTHPVLNCLQDRLILTDSENFQFISEQDTHYAVNLSIAPIIDSDESLLGTVMIFRDITQARNVSAQLDWQAKHDHLTGLINRREFERQLKKHLADAKKNQNTHCMMYIDLDQFKVINDTCGHGVGDKLLGQISQLLQNQLRQDDILARIGGDEFCALLPMCAIENALVIANTLRQGILEHRFVHNNKPYVLGASIGLIAINGQEQSAAEILSAADSACYAAKSAGRNRVHTHNAQGDGSAQPQELMQWFSRLQIALEEDLFVLYAQEIASIGSKKTPHYEVLVRMLDHDGSIIPPNSFIPAAERFHLMQRIDRWVLNKACDYLSVLEKKNKPLPIISINLSGTSIGDPHFLQATLDTFEEYKTPSKHICFEITETAAISNIKEALNFMTAMKKLHCKFSLDDFGSGLSSFSYLKNLPVDYLKIDGHFVKNIVSDEVDKAFVDSINKIAQIMNIETIAEFVENDEILDVLKTLGVNYAQGYGISTPQPLDSLRL